MDDARSNTDELTPPDLLVLRLIDVWCHEHGGKIPWHKAIEITAIITKMSDAERLRLIAFDELDGSRPSQAALDVLAERQRQISTEGWTPEHDDQHTDDELALAAASYAISANPDMSAPSFWPWDAKWWKPKDGRRNLVKAGALILAEIERLDRAAAAIGAAPREEESK